MRGVVGAACFIAAAAWLTPAASAEGIDCSKARSPSERAICATPSLITLDQQVGAAYADAVVREPGRAATIRQEQLAWLRARDAACNIPTAKRPACLAERMTDRLAQLAPPAAATTPPPTTAPQAAASPSTSEPAIPTAANPPAPAAAIRPSTVPAAEQSDAELRVTSPGRFTIAAHSATGAALQLVDQLTGPGDVAGAPGTEDGRLDLLLDVGTYRLRAFTAKGATGDVRLEVRPFTDAAPPSALPAPGAVVSAPLADGEQRAFWLQVPPSGEVQIEAAGRALADFRLWRNASDLTALSPVVSTIEPALGHPLSDLRLNGKVEPGIYLAVAYGGPALPWSDGDKATPFHLRTGLSEALDEGAAAGPIGPFGSERFRAPAFAGVFRLDLPQPADATFRVADRTATLTKTSREPGATLFTTPGQAGTVEISGAAGQAFTLRAAAPATARSLSKPGRYFVAAQTIGAGGDEPPATVLLQRTDRKEPARIVASNLPRLAPGAPWHGRFNLRGPLDLLFQNTVGGPVTLTTSGVPLGSAPSTTSQYDVPADTYILRLRPTTGASGVIDVTVGPPGPPVPLAAPLPRDPVIPLGIQEIAPGQSLQLTAQSGPGLQTGLIGRPLPVALAEGPLVVTQLPGNPPITVPVTLALGGALAAHELGGPDLAVTDIVSGDTHTITVPATDHPRTIVLAWRRTTSPRPDIPAPPPQAAVPTITAGQDLPFDLARDESRGFALEVPQGGLFRVETLGRLHTGGTLASAYIPELATAEANGAGENMLLQTWLRAGRYRVDVRATGSTGHLALRAAPAPLLPTAPLASSSAVHAAMRAGTGLAIPVTIAEDGTYHLDVLSLGNPFTVRLDDAEGWPLTMPGPQTALDLPLRKGNYRLLVSPEPVDRRLAARLDRVVPSTAITGHGPHKLPVADTQSATWREPPGRDDPRTPDIWTFDLAGRAQTSFVLTDGMVAELRSGDRTVARFTRRWSGTLDAGAYRLETTSLGRNDRLDYTLKRDATEIQPGETRTVTLPVTVPFDLAEPRIVTLTSWGTTPVKGVLHTPAGTIAIGPRPDDWNLAFSRPLPRGAYSLELAASTTPASRRATPQDPGTASPSDSSGNADTQSDSDSTDTDSTDAQTGQSTQAASSDTTADTSSADAADTTVDLRFTLPDERTVTSQPIAAATPGQLVVATARGAGAVLTLETQSDRGWQVIATDSGPAPIVAVPGASDTTLRVRAWSLDGAEPVTVRTATLDLPPVPPAEAALRQQDGLDLLATHLAVGPGPFDVTGATLAASAGHPATPIANNQVVVPTGTDLWLLARTAGPLSIAPTTFDGPRTVTVPDERGVPLPALSAEPGHFRLWRAEAGAGQPLFRGDGAHPAAPNSAIAPAATPLTLTAVDQPNLPVRLSPLDLALLPETTPGALTLPPRSALPVRLPGAGRVALALAAGTGALTTSSGSWAADAPLARDLFADGTVTLLNTTDAPAPAALRWTAEPPPAPLSADTMFKRFFGAAGSFELPVSVTGRVTLIGDGSLHTEADPRPARAVDIDRQGTVIVTHGPGPLVLYIATLGRSPWPEPPPQTVSLPGEISLTGEAMALALSLDGPTLLHATTTAPVLLDLDRGTPELFPAGAEFHRAIPGRPTTLHLYPPQDGPLTGTLTLAADPIRPMRDGVGDTVVVPPGGTAAFGFTLARPATVGVGIRAEPDRAEVRLLDANGVVKGQGVAQLQRLDAGRYALEIRVPPDAPPTAIRPALVGATPQSNGPPPDVAQHYLELVGLKPVEQGR